MYLKAISLYAIRNYARLDVRPGPGLNLFFGENAQGKTNLLEAACFLGGLRSFRGVKGAALVSWEEKEGAIKGVGGAGRGVGGIKVEAGVRGHAAQAVRRIQVNIAQGKRRLLIDGKRPGNVREYLLTLKVSSFSAEDLFLVKEYPSHRRRFLDRSIFHLHPAYLDLANQYRGAVSQMNAALKAGDRKVASAWEEVLAPLAAEVSLRRRDQAEALKKTVTELYEKVLGCGRLEVSYRTRAKGDDKKGLEESYLALLEKKRDEGFKKGYCAVGPHTDDLVMTLSGREMRACASRGQGRLALLALVLADAGQYLAIRGETPVTLLDDAFSELDEKRKDALLEYISGCGQVLLTSTDPGLLKGREGRSFLVKSNTVRAVL